MKSSNHINCTGLYKIFKVSDLEVVALRGVDYNSDDIVDAEFVENNGGQVKIVKLLEGHSSSSLIDKFEN